MLAIVGVFCDIPFVSNYAFWFAIAAYVVRDWYFNQLMLVGLISLDNFLSSDPGDFLG